MALIPLKVKKAPQTCRRVYLCDNVVVRPRSQLYAPARSTLDVVTVSRGDDWLLEAKQLHPGVLAASTLLPDHHGIAVCVVNTTQEPYVLPGDTCLGELSRVDVSAASVQSVPAPTQTQSSSTALAATEVIDPDSRAKANLTRGTDRVLSVKPSDSCLNAMRMLCPSRIWM